MEGEKDFNVPLPGGERMYQAVRSLGVDSELIIYPTSSMGSRLPNDRLSIAFYVCPSRCRAL